MTINFSDEFLRRRRGMLIRATLAQNVGTGCAFGGLATGVLALQEKFHSSLGMATMGISFTVFSMTECGPLIAGLIARFGLRAVMIFGVLLSLLGYLVVALAPTMTIVIVACALMVGPGAALFAALPPAVLASGWYPNEQGKAIGITYLPLLITFMPLLGVEVIQHFGLTDFFLLIAAIHLLLLPLMVGIAPAPVHADQARAQDAAPNVLSAWAILGNVMFWLIVLGDGILNGTAIAGSAHMLPIFSGYGLSLEAGALLLTIAGISSMAGSLLAGFACDRIGSAMTLALAGIGFALAWVLLAATGKVPSLVLASALIGICGASVFPPISTLVVRVFGFEAMSKVLGLLGLITLPFTLLMPPVAGWLHDWAGGYGLAYVGIISLCLVAALTFFGISRHLARWPDDRAFKAEQTA